MGQVLLATILISLTTWAVSAEPIPPNLIGIWATEGAEFRGEAFYLDTDGIGAIVGGDGAAVIGVRVVVTSYNPSTNTLTFDLTEYGKIQASGSLSYHPIKRIISPIQGVIFPKEPLMRRFNTVSAAVRKSIGLEGKSQ